MRKILEYTEYEPPTGKRYIKGIENSILRVKSPFSNLKLGQFVFFSVINTDKNLDIKKLKSNYKCLSFQWKYLKNYWHTPF